MDDYTEEEIYFLKKRIAHLESVIMTLEEVSNKNRQLIDSILESEDKSGSSD
jgi:hypothetical protein